MAKKKQPVGQVLGRIPSSTRIVTVTDVYDPETNPNGSLVTAETVKEIAGGGGGGGGSVTVDETLSDTSTNPIQNQWLGKRLGATEKNSIQIGYNAKAGVQGPITGVCGDDGRQVAVGHCTDGSNYGVAVGYQADGYGGAVAVGYGAVGCGFGAAVGYHANGCCHGVAVGYEAKGAGLGAAVGDSANARCGAVAVGASACTPTSYSVAVGTHAGGSSTTLGTSVLIGPYAENWTPEGGPCTLYPIVIGTNCCGMGPLADATIRVDAAGKLTVGGKPVGGGGLSADMDPVIIGTGAEACRGGVALGNDAEAGCYNAIAIGPGASAVSCCALAVGNWAIASGEESAAVGPFASALGDRAIAAGSYAESGHGGVAIGGGASAKGDMPTIAIGDGAVAMGAGAVTIGNDIGNALAKSAMLSAFNSDTGAHAFLRIIAGTGCADTYLEFGKFDTLSGGATSVKIPMDKFSLLLTANGGTDGDTQGIVGGNSMYSYNG